MRYRALAPEPPAWRLTDTPGPSRRACGSQSRATDFYNAASSRLGIVVSRRANMRPGGRHTCNSICWFAASGTFISAAALAGILVHPASCTTTALEYDCQGLRDRLRQQLDVKMFIFMRPLVAVLSGLAIPTVLIVVDSLWPASVRFLQCSVLSAQYCRQDWRGCGQACPSDTLQDEDSMPKAGHALARWGGDRPRAVP
jgi:hypothetical protein